MIPLKLWRKLSVTVNRLASIPADLVWRLLKLELIENTLFWPRYQNAIAAHQTSLPALAQAETEIVKALEVNGMYMTSLDALDIPETDSFLQSAIQLSHRLKDRALLPAFFKHHEVHATLDEFMTCPEIFNWGLNQKLLTIVEQYLGLSVGYDGASCLLSVANGREIGARAWHRDREDRRMLKICVYLNDVDAEGGPFECLSPRLNTELSQSAERQHQCIPNEEMQQLAQSISAEPNVTCIGSAGTVIFVDTARFFHRGKPPTQNNRSAVFFHYFSRRPSHPFFCHRTPFSTRKIVSLIHDLSDEQRACVTWYQHLPCIAKLIPRKRI
jgi:hypothetical protein